jgi:small Trp-rich protein
VIPDAIRPDPGAQAPQASGGGRGRGSSMWFVLIGVILIICNFFEIGPMATWNWELTGDLWKFALPFGLAVAWWFWSDASGWTKRKAMQRDADRKRDRLDRNIDAMGLGYLHKHRDGKKRSKH